MFKIKSTAEKHVDSLHPNSTLGALKAQLNNINSRALLSVKSIGHTVYDVIFFPFRNDIVTLDGINDLSSIKYNGIFTCEHDGFYLVSFFITSNTNVCHMSLYQNSNRIARASKGSDPSNQTQSLLLILKLNTGDALSVRAERNVSDWGGIDSIFSAK
ncbi:unnamed protein product [Mytilus edulis]|uniref:C1q domain-containing protein n=1 Tax=Mytilus edulis TaxID=6550 RepID=A0A8S3RXC3_MYTED|nr:unnamed protein product [Mytilus edulis]